MKRPITTLVCTLLAALCLTSVATAQAPDRPDPSKNIDGPFRATALTFYIVHTGGPLRIDLTARTDPRPPKTPSTRTVGKVLYRFFDHDENLVKWDYVTLRGGQAQRWTHSFGRDAPAGVYQVRYACSNVTMDLRTLPQRAFGVSPSRTMISPTSKDQFASVWMWIAPKAQAFSVSTIGMTGKLTGPDGRNLAALSHGTSAKVPGETFADGVLKLEAKTPAVGDYYRFGFDGLDPVILCGDQATARAIGKNFLRRPDGRLYAHRFQARMQAWIDTLTEKDLDVEPANWADTVKPWQEHPEEASQLLSAWGPFKHIDFLLRDQVVDPKDKDFGRFRLRQTPATLALAYALDRPYNPYFKNQALRNRLLLNVFRDLMELKTNDTYTDGRDGYSGGDALNASHAYTTLHIGGRTIEDEALRNLWVDAQRRIVDRFAFFRVTCENQSSHWPLYYRQLFEVTEDARFDRLARDFIEGMTDPELNRFMATGYQQEAYGPDATYQGLGACYQAVYYRMSSDETALKGLKTIYNLFNHTTAPEPDGTVQGASGFSHRTKGSWVHPQYGAGFVYMAGVLPEAAVWVEKTEPDKLSAEAILGRLRTPEETIRRAPQVLNYATAVFGPYVRMLYPADPLPDAKLPVMAQESFTRNFNDEFLAVRRPGYYFVGYLRGTADEWVKSRRPRAPGHGEGAYGWWKVQGPQAFWTPEYGNVFLSMNWNGDTHRMLRADLAGGKMSYPDYWDVQSTVDERAGLLTMRQGMIDLPMTVERRIAFAEGSLEETITVRAAEDVAVGALYEQIPLVPDKPGFELLFRREGKWTDKPGAADAVWCGNQAGEGVLITLGGQRTVSLGEKITYGGKSRQPLKIHLPARMKAGTQERLELTFKGVKKGDL